MPSNEGSHEAARWHDLQTGTSGIVERRTDEARAMTPSFAGGRNFGVREDTAIALLAINGNRQAVIGIELIAAERGIVPYYHGEVIL